MTEHQPRGVRFERHGDVGWIVLERPEASNAMDLRAAYAFGAAVSAASSAEIRTVLLTGEGERFCGGGDLSSFLTAEDPPSYVMNLAGELEGHLSRLSRLPKPVVAGVQGAVAGAGLAFVLHADLVLAERSTKFLMAYSRVGLTPDCGVSYLLPRVVGQQRALDLALTGRTLSASEAHAWGMISDVVADGQAQTRALDLASELSTGPAGALGETKRLIRSSWGANQPASAEDEVRTITRMMRSEDAHQAISRVRRG